LEDGASPRIGLKYTHFLAKVLKYNLSEETPPPPGGVRTPKYACALAQAYQNS